MDFLSPETAIRLVVIGQELLVAAIFLSGKGARVARVSGAALMLSIAGHLYMADAALQNLLPFVAPLAVLLALAVPYCLWLFARAIFEAPWPKSVWIYLFALIGSVVWGIFLFRDFLGSGWVTVSNTVMHVASLIVVAHAFWTTVRGRPDDLIERRRSFRLFFVAIVAFQVSAVLVIELALAGTVAPDWLELTNIIIIALLTIGLAVPLLRLNDEFFDLATTVKRAVKESQATRLGAAESVLKEKLLSLMGQGYYRETGLTIPTLSNKLGYPEHRLRRLINGHLGYRNFSAFLNDYRISEAKRWLTDPERARMPVLTIALDLGYASLGPFNRAFKAATGSTPTEFRHNSLAHSRTVSE